MVRVIESPAAAPLVYDSVRLFALGSTWWFFSKRKLGDETPHSEKDHGPDFSSRLWAAYEILHTFAVTTMFVQAPHGAGRPNHTG